MIFNTAIYPKGGKSEGEYGWVKHTSYPPASISFPNLQNCTISIGDGFNITTSNSGQSWGTYYALSGAIDLTKGPIALTQTINNATLLQRGCFIVFSDSGATSYTGSDFALLVSDGEVNYWANGQQVGNSLGQYVVGTVIKCVITSSNLNIYINDSLVKTVSHSLSTVYIAINPYHANTTYGVFDVQQGDGTFVGCVVSDESDAYPADGFHTDGFFYTSVNTLFGIIDTLTGDA